MIELFGVSDGIYFFANREKRFFHGGPISFYLQCKNMQTFNNICFIFFLI